MQSAQHSSLVLSYLRALAGLPLLLRAPLAPACSAGARPSCPPLLR